MTSRYHLLNANRRVQPRKPFRSKAALVLPGPTNLNVRTYDISQGGLCVLTEENLMEGRLCMVFFSLPQQLGSGFLHCQSKARVSYSAYSREFNGFKAGLQLLEISTGLEEALRVFLTS